MKTSPCLLRLILPAAMAILGLAATTFAQDVAAGTPDNTPAPPRVVIRTDLAYDAHARQKLDLYFALGHPAKPRPVIVFIHGGGWQKGSKADGRRLAFHFVAQGYAVACIDYRLSSDSIYPTQIEDCKAAVRWLRSNADLYSLDPSHIGIIGVSAGGHLAALLGAMNSARLYEVGASMDQGSQVEAVCDFFGPVDLRRLYDDAPTRDPAQAAEISQLIGGDPREQAVATRTTSPLNFLDGATCPFLIIHGDRDTTVPIEQSRRLYEALIAKNIYVHLHVIRGAGHTGPAFVTPEVNRMVDAFFSHMLKPDETGAPDFPPPSITYGDAVPAHRPAS